MLAAFYLSRLGSTYTIWFSTATVVAGGVLMRTSNQIFGTVVAALVIGMGLSAIFPTALGMAGDRFPEETGTVFGAVIGVALVGGMAGPKLGGWIASYGVRQVVLIPIFAAVSVAALTAAVSKRASRALKPSAPS